MAGHGHERLGMPLPYSYLNIFIQLSGDELWWLPLPPTSKLLNLTRSKLASSRPGPHLSACFHRNDGASSRHSACNVSYRTAYRWQFRDSGVKLMNAHLDGALRKLEQLDRFAGVPWLQFEKVVYSLFTLTRLVVTTSVTPTVNLEKCSKVVRGCFPFLHSIVFFRTNHC